MWSAIRRNSSAPPCAPSRRSGPRSSRRRTSAPKNERPCRACSRADCDLADGVGDGSAARAHRRRGDGRDRSRRRRLARRVDADGLRELEIQGQIESAGGSQGSARERHHRPGRCRRRPGPSRRGVPVLGTNPIAFAAPARRNAPFLLDMATSTVANNKIKVYELNGKPLPPGWVLDERGRPVTDPATALDIVYRNKKGGQTPVGGTAEMSSHKGYGLALMVHILGGTLSGASFSPIRVKTQGAGDPDRLGHFFLAIDPKAFRPEGAFEDDLDAVIDVLHATPPVDPALPVLVPGDPENAARARRLREGIPIPRSLSEKIRNICQRAGVAFLLE